MRGIRVSAGLGSLATRPARTVRMGIRDRIAELLGVSAFERSAPQSIGLDIDSEEVKRAREDRGGNLINPPSSRLRWYPADLERAERLADNGDLSMCGQLMRAARKDGTFSGVLSTRTDGLVRLPKKFAGDEKISKHLDKSEDQTRSVFDEMFPPSELALLASDGVLCGVGFGEMKPVPGRDHPAFIRYDPEYLVYQWATNTWFFKSMIGLIRITPGDGRWILHMPGGRTSPWQNGLWRAIGRAFINKEHAQYFRQNWEAKLANSARIATSPQGSTEQQRQGWLEQVMAWGVNTVFAVTPGWEVSLLESNGRGYESFKQTIKDCNDEIKIAVCGQLVTTDGGAGFQNSDIHKTIRSDLIQKTGDDLAYTINTQGLPVYLFEQFGESTIDKGCIVSWDTTPPKDKNSEATAATATATAITSLSEALEKHGLHLDVPRFIAAFNVPVTTKKTNTATEQVAINSILDLATRARMQPSKASVIALAARLGIELEEMPAGEEAPKPIPLAPTDIAKVVKAKEARRSIGLTTPLGNDAEGNDRDDKTVYELGETAEQDAKADGETEVAKATVEAQDANKESTVNA